jgi:hypothetical protein
MFSFFLIHYFVATFFSPPGPSSGHTGAMSEKNMIFIVEQQDARKHGY